MSTDSNHSHALVALQGNGALAPFRPQGQPREPSGVYRVLIVENDAVGAETIAEGLAGERYDCTVAQSGAGGLRLIESEHFDIVITDLLMDDFDGLKILEEARRHLPGVKVLVVTAHGGAKTATLAMHLGAFWFLEKPLELKELRTVVEAAAHEIDSLRVVSDFSGPRDDEFDFSALIGSSLPMRALQSDLRRIAPAAVRVLILGETGTGKDVVARTIHANSPRRDKRFVALNCAELNSQVLESELFGHVRGSYTGAVGDREGRFQYADGGTLFLDEVGDMPKDVQVKLLRVLENSEITPVGSNKPIKVDVRVIAATNRELETMVAEGTFRHDLYYRLRNFTLHLPPLRERGQDIKLLTDYFVQKHALAYGRTIRQVTSGVRRRMQAYAWPGNVRELSAACERMVVLAEPGGILTEEDLPPEIRGPGLLTGPPSATCLQELVGRPMEEIERMFIEETIRATGNNKEAARLLKIGERTLYRKLDQYKEDDRKKSGS
jgi:two-component system response regulator HydG